MACCRRRAGRRTAKSDTNLQAPGQFACLPACRVRIRTHAQGERAGARPQTCKICLSVRMRFQACPCVLGAGVLEAT